MYPDTEQVEAASHYQICKWYRFLKSPTSDSQVKTMNRIIDRLKKFGGFTPEISKSIGWGD